LWCVACRKSEIAFEYAKRCSTERSVFWIKADTAENLELGYTAIAHKLVPSFQAKNVDVFLAVKECLEKHNSPPWLMILDGADNPELFFGNQEGNNRVNYIPQARRGQVLVTSRDDRILSLAAGQFVSPANGLHVGPMSVDDGIALFQKTVPRDYKHRALHAQITAPEGKKFLEMLGGLPLAIIQATSYMICEGTSIQDFIDLYEKVEEYHHMFEQPARDIDKQVISVLHTWEISYRKIAETLSPDLKSQAAMVLDLLGFIDSQSSPILRKLSEAEFLFKDNEGSTPMDGFKELLNNQPGLENPFARQDSPKSLLFKVFTKRFEQNGNYDFKSATAKLQRYSLIDEDCWVPPVVHSWISHRLPTEERCKYIQWLIEELWQQILLADDDFNIRWESFLLPPGYRELVFHELPQLRHARVILDHASSKNVLDSMTLGNYFAHESVELLYRLGRMLTSAGKTKDGIHYLEKAIAGMDSLVPALPANVLSERRLQLAKARHKMSSVEDAIAEAKRLSEGFPSYQAALWLAQCLQIAGEIRDASVIFQNIIAVLSTECLDAEFQRVVFAANFGAANTLSLLADTGSKMEARNIIDRNLIPFLRGLDEGHMLRTVLYPEILICRLGMTVNAEDQRRAVQNFMDYNNNPYEESLTGGRPLDWRSVLTKLREQKNWSVIVGLGEAFVEQRRPLMEIWALRWDVENNAQLHQVLAELEAWVSIHSRLGIAYSELKLFQKADQAHWTALGLCLALALKSVIDPTLFQTNIWRLHETLVVQKKDRSCQTLMVYFGDDILTERMRRTHILARKVSSAATNR
jgi:tetratricopeptide (TPR) repeat protein